jgi:alcohol dehydrogenase class IV
MSPHVVLEPGAIERVGALLDDAGLRSAFLVTGRESFRSSGAQRALAGVSDRIVGRFSDFESNPKLADIEMGLQRCRRARADSILAIGGGSVLDTAKLIATLSQQSAPPLDIVLGREAIRVPGLPVTALPTTAGTGSEVTHFAVIYVENRKYSLAHETMRPAYAIVDPELTYSMPPKTTAITGLDAFTQAVESMWSVHATAQSKHHAREAINLALKHLPDAVHRPQPTCRLAMSKAAHLAGKAIDITRTTAPHAISYTMTSRFDVAHGLAVALTLAPMMIYNAQVTSEDCMSEQGADHVREAIAELNALLNCSDAESSARRITELIKGLGLPTRLSEVGIERPADRKTIVDNVNVERLANNPRRLTREALKQIIESIA